MKASISPLIRWAYLGFLCVLVPVYAYHYGWSNFLYFCDVALLLTAYGLLRQSSLAVSVAAVGILLPQLFWCGDYLWQWYVSLSAGEHRGMTAYMFDAGKPLYLRGLSLFHGWLPFLLLYLLRRMGYDRRALKVGSVGMVALCLLCYFCLPAAGGAVADANTPRNVNYVYGLDDAQPQSWLPAPAYLTVWMLALFGLIYYPTHRMLSRWLPQVRG